MSKSKKNSKYTGPERINRDVNGNVINEAFPVSKRTVKDQSKTSVGYTAFSVLLYVIAILPLMGVTIALALKTYNALPSYGIWHFIGLLIMAAFSLIFIVVTLIVTRKKSRSSIFGQTAKVAFTYFVLTVVFGLILTYIVPDIIANATSSTLYADDLFYNADEEINRHVEIERDFVKYNLLNGNLNEFDENGNVKTITNAQGETVEIGDFSYKGLSKRATSADSDTLLHFAFANQEIDNSFQRYVSQYASSGSVGPDPTSMLCSNIQNYIDTQVASDPVKLDLYEHIYNNYVLNDFEYALRNNVGRRALALAILDFEYNHSPYVTYLSQGFGNKRLKALFDANYDNFNQDGYNTFDDPLLLYAQMNGRMTVPVVLRLILNGGWSYSQPYVNEEGLPEYNDDIDILYTMYDRTLVDEFIAAGGTFDKGETTIPGLEGEYAYGTNEDGWLLFANGYVKRPVNWLVLDMLGDPMDITSVDLSGANIVGLPIDTVLDTVFKVLDGFPGAVGGLLQEDVDKLVQYATSGAKVGIGICIDDSNALAISINPTNAQYGINGYQWATWMQSNNLLMAVLNVMNLRNWLFYLAGAGILLIVMAGVLRECGRRTRERTAKSRDRLMRAGSVEAAGAAAAAEAPATEKAAPKGTAAKKSAPKGATAKKPAPKKPAGKK